MQVLRPPPAREGGARERLPALRARPRPQLPLPQASHRVLVGRAVRPKGSERGEVLLRGIGTLRHFFPQDASVQWQPDGVTIHPRKWFLGAGFLGAPPVSLKGLPGRTHCSYMSICSYRSKQSAGTGLPGPSSWAQHPADMPSPTCGCQWDWSNLRHVYADIWAYMQWRTEPHELTHGEMQIHRLTGTGSEAPFQGIRPVGRRTRRVRRQARAWPAG